MPYGTLSGADAYHLARGSAAWAAKTTDERNAALVRAADYIRLSYVRKFTAGYDDSVADVEPATYEAALLEAATPGFFSATYTEAQSKVLTEVKGIKWTVTGQAKAGDFRAMAPKSSIIEALLAPYMVSATVSSGIGHFAV